MLRQLTHAKHGHILTNAQVWSKDSDWIVFDTRSDAAGSVFDGAAIQRVWVDDGRVETLYESRYEAHCGVATVCPRTNRVVFIYGPEHPTEDWQYTAWNRRGLIVDPTNANSVSRLEALDFVPPFTPGATRGGSHVHMFSPCGQFVSFTYEDRILQMAGRDATNDGTNSMPQHSFHKNQRNVGLTWLQRGVEVTDRHPRNESGSGYSIVATQTTCSPSPGSDEIQKAYEDAWIGDAWFGDSCNLNAAGDPRKLALAFLGDCVTERGALITELFVVDIPQPPWFPGRLPLEGTATTRMAPPQGTRCRRLTRTADRAYPGIQGPRHWPRSHPDGSHIAVLLKDVDGKVQIHLVETATGSIFQLTDLPYSVESAFTWSPDGRSIAFVADHSIFVVDCTSGVAQRLTPKSYPGPCPEAVVFSPDGFQIAFVRPVSQGGKEHNQIFVCSSCK